VLTAGDVMRTLAVEATIHHLDLTVSLDGAPAPSSEGLTLVRETSTDCSAARLRCTGTRRYVRVATGRAALSDAEREQPGADADGLPLSG
jgi:hypothetical protein